MGSSKTPGDNLILREDQKEFQRGLKMEQGRKIKEDRELERAVKLQMEGKTAGLGSWNDPDVSRTWGSAPYETSLANVNHLWLWL
jgi:hypothetical protein